MNYQDGINLATICIALVTAFLVLSRNPKAVLYRLMVYYLATVAAWAFIDFETNIFFSKSEFIFWKRFDIFWYLTTILQLRIALEYIRSNYLTNRKWILNGIYLMAICGIIFHLIFLVPVDAIPLPNGIYQPVYLPEYKTILDLSKLVFMGIAFISCLIFLRKYLNSEPRLKGKAGLMLIAFSFPVVTAMILEGWFHIIQGKLFTLHITNSLMITSIFITVMVFRYRVLDLGNEVALPAMLHALPDGVILTDESGVITYYNQSASKIVGLSGKKLWITPIFELLELTNSSSSLKDFLFAKKDVADFECLVKSYPENNAVSVSLSFIRDREWITGMIFLIRDISKRLEVEKELRNFRTAIDQSPATIAITDPDGAFEYVNPGFERITGYTFKEVIGKNPRILKSGLMPEYTYRELWATITSGHTWFGEFINRKKNGEFYWESAVITPVKNEEGKILNYIALKEDISQRKKAEEALLRSEHDLRMINDQKDRFLSIIAHDLRAPFNILVNASEIVYSKYNELDESEILMLIESIHNSATNTYGLLENLLLWSRSQLGRIELNLTLFDLVALVKEVVETLTGVARNKEITIINEFVRTTFVLADRNMILMIIRNLVSNALKFTPREGSVRISPEPEMSVGEQSGMIRLGVHDSGVGMSKDIQNKLFRIDQNVTSEGTENEPGTGLGLILCREFIEKNGGSIQVESEQGKGSSFIISIKKGTPGEVHRTGYQKS